MLCLGRLALVDYGGILVVQNKVNSYTNRNQPVSNIQNVQIEILFLSWQLILSRGPRGRTARTLTRPLTQTESATTHTLASLVNIFTEML